MRRWHSRLAPTALLTGLVCIACADMGERSDADVAIDRDEASELPAFDLPALSVSAFRAHASALAHDSMAGRAPGTPGGEMAASYLAGAFRQAGLTAPDEAPGYRQEVPLRRLRIHGESVLATVTTEAGSISLGADDLIIESGVGGRRVALDVPLEFIGHGVSSPDAGWDDYAGRDVAGAFVVLMPGTPEELVSRLPHGAAEFSLSTEGRSSAARRHGARGVIALTPPGADEAFASRRRMSEVVFPVPSWRDSHYADFQLTLGPRATGELLAAAGTDWERASADAARAEARFADGLELDLEFDQDVSELTAPNIVGVVDGTTEEIVVVTAHYDGYGIGPPTADGDSIYNASMDNADGTAAIVELARVFAGRAEPPRRTLVFVATTAEEGGMVGARYYLDNPVGSVESIVVNVNVDGLGFSQPTDDFTVFPVEGTDLVPTLERIAAPLGMSFRPEPWHRGMHFAFDAAEFLDRGIVGMTVWQGSRVREAFRGESRRRGPTHSPSDEYEADSGDEGIEQHLALYLAILEHYAAGGATPRLTPGHPFENIGRTVPPSR